MANLKISELKTDFDSPKEMIDLKSAEAHSEAFTAFTTLRGGLAASYKQTCWACWAPN